MTHQYGTVKGDTILNGTTADDETWAVLQMHHPYSPPNACFDQNLMVIVVWDIQGCFTVMPLQKMERSAWYYMLFLRYHLNGAGREKCP
jgi:hypothetical protein